MKFTADMIRATMGHYAASKTPGMATSLRSRVNNADATVPASLLAEARALLDGKPAPVAAPAKPKRSAAEIAASYGLTMAELVPQQPASIAEQTVNIAPAIRPKTVAAIRPEAVAAAREFNAARKR